MADHTKHFLPPVAILGGGRFGLFLAEHLAARTTVGVWDRREFGPELSSGIEALTLEEACRMPVVILAVPIRALPEVLRAISPRIAPGTLVIDTASVKLGPIRWMEEELPAHVQILATHPLFGPDSATSGLPGQKIVVIPVRLRHPRLVRSTLASLGLRCIESTGEQHDLEMAETQALAHWIGRGLERIDARPRSIDTLGYRRLLEILHYVKNDSWELFEDLERWNPYAAQMRQRFLAELADLDRRIGSAP